MVQGCMKGISILCNKIGVLGPLKLAMFKVEQRIWALKTQGGMRAVSRYLGHH